MVWQEKFWLGFFQLYKFECQRYVSGEKSCEYFNYKGCYLIDQLSYELVQGVGFICIID